MLTEKEGADVPGEVEALKVHKSERLMTKVQDYVGEVAARHRTSLVCPVDGMEPAGGDFLCNANPEKNRREVAPK